MFEIELRYETTYTRNLEAINSPTEYIQGTGSNSDMIRPASPPRVIRLDYGRIEIYYFKFQYVSKKFTAYYFGELCRDPQNPIYIDAQTGCGKTYMIFNILFPVMVEQSKRLLIMVSRSELKEQVKYDAIKAAIPDQEGYWTPKGISHEHIFGDIEVYSYQDLENPSYRKTIEKNLSSRVYGAVVFDECHYFISDADFNPYTENQFRFLIKAAIQARVLRLYLSATPDYIFDEIYDMEKSRGIAPDNPYNSRIICQPPAIFKHYYFYRDYSYLRVKFFPDDKLLDIIAKATNGKVLVFAESNKWAIEQIKLLAEKGITSTFLLNAESRKQENDPAKNVIEALRSNQIGVNVLFATKCLDAGVTINTKNLTIICYFKDKVDFIQAIGRKRLVNDNEKVNLFIPIYTEKDIKKYMGDLKHTTASFKQNLRNYPNGKKMNGHTGLPHPVYVEDGKYRHNAFALKKLRCQTIEANSLLDEIHASDEQPEITIAKHMLAWLGLENTFSMDLMIGLNNPSSSDKSAGIFEIIQEYADTEIDQATFEILQEKLKPYDPRVDQRPDRAELSTQTMNKIFKENHLPYTISKRTNKPDNTPTYTLDRKGTTDND